MYNGVYYLMRDRGTIYHRRRPVVRLLERVPVTKNVGVGARGGAVQGNDLHGRL